MLENIPPIGKAFAFVRNIKERLMTTVSVIDAHVVPKSQTDLTDENLFLVEVNVYPAKRQTRYDAVSVQGCRLLYFVNTVDESGFRRIAPDWSRGAVESIPIDLLVSPDTAQCRPSILLFFVQPEGDTSLATIKLHSPYFLMSVSCDIRLAYEVSDSIVRKLHP